MASITLTPDLVITCRTLLLACNEFDSPGLLEDLFEPNEVLRPHAKDLPKTERKSDLVDRMIAFLLRLPSTRNEPPLIVFLILLRDRRAEGDGRRVEFDQLINSIRSANPSIKSINSQAKKAREEDQQWQEVIRERKESLDESIDDSLPSTAEEWFAVAGDDLEEWTFRIALAVFNGTSYEVINRAKKSLFKRLQPPQPPPMPPKKDDPPPPLPPAIPVRKGDQLRKAFAKEEQISLEKPKVVQIKNPRLAEEALRYVWSEFEDWRPHLSDWLTEYAVGYPIDVRLRTSVALGVLLAADYVVARRCLLFPWANMEGDRAAEFRVAVGKALAFVIAQEEGKDIWLMEVEKLLSEWSSSNELALRWTAARAYIYVGEYIRPTSKVIDQWQKIAASEDELISLEVMEGLFLTLSNPLHLSLADAMMTFFWNVVQKPSTEALLLITGCLEGLKKWAEGVGKAPETANPGLEMFVKLTKVYKPLETAEETWPPILLDLVEIQNADSSYRTTLAWLFNRALRHPALIQETIEQLRFWLAWIEDAKSSDQQLYETRFVAILQDIVKNDPAGGRMNDRLAHYLQSWANHTNSKLRLPIAQRVLNRLKTVIPSQVNYLKN